MSVVLVYDVEISQPGRKNLAVGFNLINLIHTKLAAAPKTPSPVARRSARSCEGLAIDIRHGAPRNSSMPSKLIRPFSSVVSIVEPAIHELGRRLSRGRSARRISALAPGSGDRRAGQFALAKGKLHGLLSGAEP